MSPVRPAAIAAAVAAWALATETGLARHRALASPSGLARALVSGVHDGSFPADAGATVARVGAALAVGLSLGALVGGALGLSRRASAWGEPPLDFLRAVPPLLLLPLLFLALGYGDTARVAAAALAVVLVVSLHVAAGVRRIPASRARTLRALGATAWQRVRWHLAYELRPALLVSAKHGVSTALVVTVVAEMLAGAEHGLGARAVAAQVAYDAPSLWLALLTTGALGLGLGRALDALERRFVTWPA